ncbi:hypothetical protein Ddye_015393 [Dipteronia dyeriana]|uniref:Ribosomal protein L34Ae n=1 Tax=Dipteronia dyeriana TaxID=168575 RepID=A0AAD9U5C8_9ROSI|nr:hypothetical protein Ddye_015393 [Dipteronia dyeriana]
MQHCSKEESLSRFFYNVSSFFFLLLLSIHYSSIFLAKFFYLVGSYPLIQRNHNEYDTSSFSEEEEEEDYDEGYFHVDTTENHHHHQHHLVADIIHGGESLLFLHNNNNNHVHQEFTNPHDQVIIEDQDHESFDSAQYSSHDGHDSSPRSESEANDGDDDESEAVEQEIPRRGHNDSVFDSVANHRHGPTALTTIEIERSGLMDNDEKFDESFHSQDTENNKKVETNLPGDEKFFVLGPTQLKSKKFNNIQIQEKDDEEIFGDSYTVGSTSKSSSDWRSSITCRDSGLEDPFSSSSRRSCPKWESYTVFQKYDEEMMFLDRVSAQKLQETESLRSIQACPRSISERIVHRFATINKNPSDIRHNPYHELEAAYVAQICLTWEALNWNYKNFQRKRASRKDFDMGCPAQVAQQFQQFQVLLQRYIENEPYEQGRRPEVYARMRLLAPKLLLVPEYRDSEDDHQKDEGFASRITSASFVMIMEEGIRTFMNFLKADKERPCQILKSFFGRNRKGSVDPTLLNLIKKVNCKKKTKLKDLRRSRKCIRKRKLTVDEEIEILMGQIDLKVVSRVLRMSDLNEEQMHWCEEKMSKVRILEGKLQRDSLPLFFPAH